MPNNQSTTLFDATSRNHMPGDLLDTVEISLSTLRRWESRGWISGRGSGQRLAYCVLTIDGYRIRTGAE
jgi:hypothetical protein